MSNTKSKNCFKFFSNFCQKPTNELKKRVVNIMRGQRKINKGAKMLEQYTLRIYDSKLVNRLEKCFKECKDIYPTKNPFLVDCISRGMEAIERDLLGNKNLKNFDELYTEIKTTVDKLNLLIKLSEKNSKEMMANITVSQRLLSSNYNMLLGLSSNAPKKSDIVEAGMYDDLPPRMTELLEEILNVFLKK